MNILLIHQNFPGQFRQIAQAWASSPGWNVLGIGRDTAPGLPGVKWLRYKPHREPGKEQHHYLRQMESAVLHGQAVARVLQKLKAQGYVPDVILAHPGWGETLYVRDVYPGTKLIHFCEWFYGTAGSDVGFDPEFPSSFDAQARLRTWNALHALNLEHCDVGISPTQWQRSRHPAIFQPKIQLAHEGIDTDLLQPDDGASLAVPGGTVLKAGDPVITYVARNLEPYRGFHSFMRALEKIQKAHPRCHAVVVGGDGISYGQRPADAPCWRERMLREVTLDLQRVHFLGKVPYHTFRKVLHVSAAHVYLTYPFVLSWSMLEAMASGCLVVGSRTAPVEEVLQHGVNGLLVDFFDAGAMADHVVEALEGGSFIKALRAQARADAKERYDFAQGERAYRALLAG
ncbi:glycosyltransferase [Aquabacterium soli]|uniref:Glycosyltransferase n=1 Tax=Aquabacterium soli TaxID=2493092 RepID=A0A3R8S8T8_9BURK|nr:glycosyltransferase family 4 protein [Aquabacterium soli]RRS04975.1 glycosyltransferase [Aquabacterium soli]